MLPLADPRTFPGAHEVAYLNTAAEGLPPAALEAALGRYARDKARASDGRPAMLAVEQRCREKVAALLGATAAEVAFTASCAHGLNAALQAGRLRPRRRARPARA